MTKKKILVIAPHPDDETLGCGGTLLRHNKEGYELHWMIVTRMSEKKGWNRNQIEKRSKEIERVARAYKFKQVHQLNLIAGHLESTPLNDLIKKIGSIFKTIKPNIVYIPFFNDVHTDHQITFKAVSVCIKWFRYPSISKVLMYETLSETNFNYGESQSFQPNVFLDISKYINKKFKIMNIYKSEIKKHPFPRSKESIKSLAILRGSQSGFVFAEAFQILLDRVK